MLTPSQLLRSAIAPSARAVRVTVPAHLTPPIGTRTCPHSPVLVAFFAAPVVLWLAPFTSVFGLFGAGGSSSSNAVFTLLRRVVGRFEAMGSDCRGDRASIAVMGADARWVCGRAEGQARAWAAGARHTWILLARTRAARNVCSDGGDASAVATVMIGDME